MHTFYIFLVRRKGKEMDAAFNFMLCSPFDINFPSKEIKMEHIFPVAFYE